MGEDYIYLTCSFCNQKHSLTTMTV